MGPTVVLVVGDARAPLSGDCHQNMPSALNVTRHAIPQGVCHGIGQHLGQGIPRRSVSGPGEVTRSRLAGLW